MSEKFEYGNRNDLTNEEKEEVLEIRNEYEMKDKREGLYRLRELKKKEKRLVVLITVFMAVLGTLVFGTGLSMVLEWQILLWGSVVAVVGIAIMIASYPVHNAVSHHLSNKNKEEVLKLTSALLEEKTEE